MENIGNKLNSPSPAMIRSLFQRGSVVQGALKFQTCAASTSSKLEGKVAVVTASTNGIGFAIARRLAQDGAKVMISSRKEKNVADAVSELTKEGLNVSGLVCHVAKAEDRDKLFKETVKKFGGIDILVSNAGTNPSLAPLFEMEERAWDKLFEINVKAGFLLTKEAVPYIRQRGGGSVVYIASIAGYQPLNLLGAYSITKTTLLGMTKVASVDLASDNIRVNCVAPGIIKTKFSAALTEEETAREETLKHVPLDRLGKPEEIGSVVSFLVSDDASYITGETIIAAGGMPSRL